MLPEIIGWLDAQGWRYWLVALVATALWMTAIVAPWRDGNNPVPTRRAKELDWWLWAGTSLFLLLAWRWPFMLGSGFNPDEPQMIAGAITLKRFPVFWKYVDGTTHGPLVDLPLVLGNIIGIPLNYAGARFIAGALVIGGLLVAARGLGSIYPMRAVRIGLAPVLFLWASISFYDFSSYSSEQAPIFLILASLWPLLSALSRTDISQQGVYIRLAIGATLLGSVPFAKLQGIPIAAAVGGLATVATIFNREWSFRRRVYGVAALISGALAPAVACAVYLWIWGLGPQFWQVYIINNRLYASNGLAPWASMLSTIWEFIRVAPGLQTTIVVNGLLCLAAAVWVARRTPSIREYPWIPGRTRWSSRRWWAVDLFTRRRRAALSALLLLLLVSVYATLAPRRGFGHYLQLLLPAVAICSAVLCGEAWLVSALSRRFQRYAFALLGALIVPLLVARALAANPDLHGSWTRNHGEWRSPASLAILRHARPDDTMSVWGWMPFFYVETGLPHATREAHTYWQIESSPMNAFYRERYLRDFTRRSPRIFVDAVGGRNFGYGDEQRHLAHESFPELAKIIARDFTLVDTVAGTRIYVRK